jgi:transposase
MKLTSENIDNLGLVAGMCDEIGISDIIDQACGTQAKNKNLSFGQCVKCMILNGLGFIGRTLYLYSEYFEDKPIDHLLGIPITSEQIDDNVLGRTLDKLFSLGVSELFTQIALKAMRTLDIKVKSLHLDSTSFHVDGDYFSLLEQDESRIKLVQGYSRDHRPDLNQVVLQMITSNQGNIPLFMQAASGNSSDKTAFAEIIAEHAKSFKAAVENRYLVGDSALYTPNSIKAMDEAKCLFVTRVPSQIKAVGEHIAKSDRSQMMNLNNGYYAKEQAITYAEVNQRWMTFFSQAAYERESKTLAKNYLKGSEKELKAFTKLTKEVFNCRNDALKHYKREISKYTYLEVNEFEIIEVQKHPTIGRPKKGCIPLTAGYQIRGFAACSLGKKQEIEKGKGFFILATNDKDVLFSAQEILETYKSQQSVERGFRFLKSPDFLVSSFFLKKPERIEALLMVMTLCLLVYAALEYKIRKKLRENGENFLDQKKKPSKNPTTRWVFFCFLGLHIVYVNGKKNQVTNLKDRHRIILHCLGPPYQKLYYSELW